MKKFVKTSEFKAFQVKYGLLSEHQFIELYGVHEKHLKSLIKSNLRRFAGKFYYKAFGEVFLDRAVYDKVLEREEKIKFNKNRS
jgi:hypothetical protein